MIRNKPIGDLKQDKAISSAIYNMKGHVHTLAKLKQDMRSTVKKTNNHIIHLNMMMTLLIAVKVNLWVSPH